MEHNRTVCTAPVQIRTDGEKRKLRGYAAVFDSLSNDLGGFREIIRKGAFDATLAEINAGKRDVSARLQHNGGLTTIGRVSNGTLRLWTDKQGLLYEIDPPDTQAGRDAVELVDKGYLNKSSFAFSIRPNGRKWDTSQSPPVQELLSVDLHDVAPVDGPAYEATTVQARSAALASLRMHAMADKTSGYQIRANDTGGERIELYFLDQIVPSWMSRYLQDTMSSAKVIEALKEAPDASGIDVFINSPGGDVFEAMTIYNTLKEHPAPVQVYVRGLAASAAGIVAMAGDHIQMGEGSFLMVHNAWTVAMGNSLDMYKQAALLDKIDGEIAGILSKRSKNEIGQVKDWMREETWFAAEDAVNAGFADRTTGEPAELTTEDGERCRELGFRHIPKSIGGSSKPIQRASLSPREMREMLEAEIAGTL